MNLSGELPTLKWKLSGLEATCCNLQGRIEELDLDELVFYLEPNNDLAKLSRTLLDAVGAFLTANRENVNVTQEQKRNLVQKTLRVRSLAIKTQGAIVDRWLVQKYSFKKPAIWKRILRRIFLPWKQTS